MGALFFGLSRLTVTPRSELRPVKLLALPNCYGAPPAFPVFIKMSWWASLRQGRGAQALLCETEEQGQARAVGWMRKKHYFFPHLLSQMCCWCLLWWRRRLKLGGFFSAEPGRGHLPCGWVFVKVCLVSGTWRWRSAGCALHQSPVAVGLGSLCNPTDLFDVLLMNSGITWLPY